MAATQRLELRQAQSLVMTPQLQQAIKLLQLSNIELAAYVEGELEQNPLLERDEGAEQGSEGDRPSDPTSAHDQQPPDESRASEADEESWPDSLDRASSDALPAAGDDPLDADYENVFDGNPWEAGGEGAAFATERRGAAETQGEDNFVEQRLAETPTLREHLTAQLTLEIADPVGRLVGQQLIDLLDPAGYLNQADIDALPATLGCEAGLVDEVLKRMQAFEPAGIFARSLRECLMLQLIDRNRYDPAMAALLDNLDRLAAHDLAGLRARCGVDDDDLLDMIAELRALDPKPAAGWDSAPAEPLVPDILVRRQPNGAWQVELNADTLPRVLVNASYYTTVQKRTRSRQERDYLQEQFQSANWLVKALHQRATTILKVATEIVRQQDGFLRKGVQEMRPLTLRAVAEAIEMHESTVSRVTANKYIATPRGIFELRFFFSSSIGGVDGASHSAEAVRHRIRGLIERESGKSVLSDDRIVEILRADGIEIARRTVAKYREAMRIPSSVERRRLKALQQRPEARAPS